MKSILDLLDTIMRTPGVDDATRTRAGFLRVRLAGGGFRVVMPWE